MLRTAAFVLAMFSGVAAVSAADVPSPNASHTQEIEQWRANRVARLTAPTGWLSLIGLEWLNEGANRVGSAADNDIVLKAGPAHLGTVTLAADGAVRIALANDHLTRAQPIDILVTRGIANLSGNVSTEAVAHRALSIARSTGGVTAVQDAMKVEETPAVQRLR